MAVKHLHKVLNLTTEDELRIGLTAVAHVYLLDDENYQLYLDEQEFEYYGETAHRSPCRLKAPWAGVWHLAIEPADPADSLNVAVEIVSPPRGR